VVVTFMGPPGVGRRTPDGWLFQFIALDVKMEA
jgi:hypothetical protein